MNIKRVSLTDLKFANYNPKNRTAKESRKMKNLVDSIEKIGLLYPILISPDNEVIDGHRRVCAVRQLNWEDIPALITKGDNNEQLYAEVNANAFSLNARERLAVWLKNPNAVTPGVAEKYEKVQELYGRQLMVRASEHGHSASIFNCAEKIANYTGRAEEDGFRTKAAQWLIKHRNPRIASYYMNLGQPPKQLYRAVMEGRPLSKKVRVHE